MRDNGVGLPAGWQLPRDGGVGLKNVAARLEHLYGRRRRRCAIEPAAGGGVDVQIDASRVDRHRSRPAAVEPPRNH